MSETFKCPSGCCCLQITPYVDKKDPEAKLKRTKRKAGMFIIDPTSGKILIVQSRGRLWGPPKGTLEQGETEPECAIREIKEETGLDVHVNYFSNYTKIKNRAIYYYAEVSECEVSVQEHISYNDVNSIGWIYPNCLAECIQKGNISVTHHTRILLRKYLGQELPSSHFVLVKRN